MEKISESFCDLVACKIVKLYVIVVLETRSQTRHRPESFCHATKYCLPRTQEQHLYSEKFSNRRIIMAEEVRK